MKIYILLGTILFVLISCSSTKVSYPSSESTYITKKGKDVILIKTVGYGSTIVSTLKNAEKKTFELILFKGLPNSELQNPLIYDEKTAKNNFSSFFYNFFEEEGYRNYIVSSKQISKIKDDVKNKSKQVEIEIAINIHSLRNKLEQNGIIKKFGL